MEIEFDAVLLKVEGLDATYIEPPFDVEKQLGAKRVKVKASVDGAEYRGSIVRMGGSYMLGITQAIRKAIGKGPGDTVHVVLEKDDQERIVVLPEELAAALSRSTAAKTRFDTLSFTKRKQLADWIRDAAKAETRLARAEKALSSLLEGKTLK